VGLCYAELSSLLPVAGSTYTYTYATLGELAAWIIGWDLIMEYVMGSAAVAVGWSGYLVSVLKSLGVALPPTLTTATGQTIVLADGTTATAIADLPAAAVVLLITALLVGGTRESARLNNIMVALKLAVVLAFIGLGAFYVNSANWHPFVPDNTGTFGSFGVSGILRGASIVFFAYIGFEAVSTAGQEAKNPAKDMPFGIIGSLVVCTVIYMLVAAIMTLLVPYQSLNVPDPVAVVVDNFGPQWGWLAKIIKVGAIIGLTSVVLVLMYAQTRIFYTMARDGLLPKVFSRVHPKFKTPAINTVLVGVITAVAAGFFDINVLGDMTSVGTLAAFAIVCLSVIYLRRAAPELPRGFTVPFYPVLPVLGILSCLYLITTVPWNVLQFFLWYMLGGVVLYFAYGMHNSNLQHGESQDDAPDMGEFPGPVIDDGDPN
jgi:APA family basic amino acid/polyamine antiporter